MLIHPQEALLQEARALQQSADYDQYRSRRVVARASTGSPGTVRHSAGAYFGRVKTKFQLYLAATVANLTLLANQTDVFGDPGNYGHRLAASGAVGGDPGVGRHLLPTWVLAWLTSSTLALTLIPTRAFRPAF